MKLVDAIRRINVMHPVCKTVFGANHHFAHRAVFGVGIMIGGVVVAKTLGHHPEFHLAVIGDTLGYGLHGVGLIPFVEEILALAEME